MITRDALFGYLQVVAVRQPELSPILMVATNSSGGVIVNMISPQNLCTGAAMAEYKGRERLILAGTFNYSIILTLFLGILVLLQQYVFPWMIPLE